MNRHIEHHGLHQGLSFGWLATIWLSHILSQGDHRKVTVRDWVKQSQNTLEKVTGLNIRETDFTDDRLTLLLEKLSKIEIWIAIEAELNGTTIRVYDLEQKKVRIDTTTVSGYHEGGEDRLLQYGHSKDDSSLKQIKVLIASLDPLGMPLITEVLSGEKADDKLYVPAVDRVVKNTDKKGLLFIGDCKMSALDTRGHIYNSGHHYLMPLSMVGNNRDKADDWIKDAMEKENELTQIYVTDHKGKKNLLAEGCEIQRNCCCEKDGKEIKWDERVLIVKSESYAKTLQNALDKRLEKATKELLELTPQRGRGKRQIEDEKKLCESADAILKTHRVEGLLIYNFERQETIHSKFIGRGRGTKNRSKREIVNVRYQINDVIRNEDGIKAVKKTFGWRIFVTDMCKEILTFEQAVMTYRDEWIIERGFHRLKGAPLSLDPMFVKRDDQIIGLTYLLTIAIRFLTLIEFVVRRNLKKNDEKLVGLNPENPKKAINNPTTERLLKAFNGINLTIVHLPQKIIRYVTPLNSLQVKILALLGFSSEIYTSLVT
ncbi:MAG: IS1634 family transposase [Desulfobacterales bacterium]|nr:IS1634 family transposase [Desulfobacterales bacterium]